jgi:phenylalanine-4-hydroxylase
MHAGGLDNLVQLDRDHPGFRDATYRRRRDDIARIALDYRSGEPVPSAPYTAEEHRVWARVRELLDPLHREHAHPALLEHGATLGMPTDRIPQLSELNPVLTGLTGFRMEPVAGLVEARTFLEHLGRRVFLSTQYIRHHSRPLYTPEPDVVHELIGHAASLLHPGVAELSVRFGGLAARASDTELPRLVALYWYTLEFGLVRHEGRVKGFGAGVLSSIGELGRAVGLSPGPSFHELDLEAISSLSYDPTDYQERLYVASSLEALLGSLSAWLDEGGWAD